MYFNRFSKTFEIVVQKAKTEIMEKTGKPFNGFFV